MKFNSFSNSKSLANRSLEGFMILKSCRFILHPKKYVLRQHSLNYLKQ
jgi:hypothetical protein